MNKFFNFVSEAKIANEEFEKHFSLFWDSVPDQEKKELQKKAEDLLSCGAITDITRLTNKPVSILY